MLGSSPLTRGKQNAGLGQLFERRLIPAHAGKTPNNRWTARRSRAHPRSRGENLAFLLEASQDAGSSPLTRGKPSSSASASARAGLIPAHAGKTVSVPNLSLKGTAHPRSRGENLSRIRLRTRSAGSSPLTRGKPERRFQLLGCGRLIPAHAGKTLPDMRFYCADRSDLGNP